MTGYSFTTPVWDGGTWVTPVVAPVRMAPKANGPEDQPRDAPSQWDRIDWRAQEGQVRRLRQRIFKASQEGDWPKVRNLQKLMLRSRANTLVSVRQVTQRNAGRKTAGIDGEVALTSPARAEVAVRVHQSIASWCPRAVRRVYIPKASNRAKLRPLGIPVLLDRCHQQRVRHALEPEWEARFEPRSYGFRPGRGCHDAIAAIYNVCAGPLARHVWALDADLAAAFDRIDHDHLLAALGSFPARDLIRGWLKAGVFEAGKGVSRLLLADLARRAPLLPGKDTVAFLDIDSMQKRVYGHKKQGAAFGHTKIQGKSLLVRGLNALAATISTPLAAPVIAATRLRGGSAASARGAASFATASVTTARSAGCSGILVARADSAFYSAAFTGAVRRAGAFFSVTVRMDPKVKAAITAIEEAAWTPIRYPRAVWDDQLHCWISDAQVAEVTYTAFTSKRGQAITARLIVRRVKDLNRTAAPGRGELFPAWRYHAIFTDSLFETIQAEEHHRGHAQVEQVFADLTDGPLAHLPSVISSRLRAVFDVRDGGFLGSVVRGGGDYLAPSITEMTGVFGARAACGDAVGCGVVDRFGR